MTFEDFVELRNVYSALEDFLDGHLDLWMAGFKDHGKTGEYVEGSLPDLSAGLRKLIARFRETEFPMGYIKGEDERRRALMPKEAKPMTRDPRVDPRSIDLKCRIVGLEKDRTAALERASKAEGLLADGLKEIDRLKIRHCKNEMGQEGSPATAREVCQQTWPADAARLFPDGEVKR